MNEETKELLKEIKAYRDDMVARNYPFQELSNIITKWEMKRRKSNYKVFLEEAEKEKKELKECYEEAKRQTEERKSKEWINGYNKWKKDSEGS